MKNAMSGIKSVPVWKWALLLIASLLLSILLYAFGSMPSMLMKGWPMWLTSIGTAAAMLGLYALFVRWFESEKPKDLPMNKCLKHTGMGFMAGLLFFTAVVAIMMLAGLYKAVDICKDWKGLADALFLFLIVGIGEEIIFRGVMFRWIDQRFGFWWAMGISALVFGIVHITNDNATLWSSLAIALEAGLLLGAAYKWAGSLWFPIAIHWAWNFSQGNIFGFAVSGQYSGVSLIQADINGPEWLTGGAFGAEASVISVILGTTIAIWLTLKIINKEK
ncbi:MAG: CPBP family intramembrane metalloprotease [Bacteroidales bacterium]|nr:CPBP family intramembrane metalloprotease [Bacteroidales bacterium]